MNAIIAVNPQQMQEAQNTTMGWVSAKLADAQHELTLADETFASLENAGLRTQPAAALRVKAKRRISFYTKLLAALNAGYHIIPPFNIQLFAVRTDRASPNERGERRWPNEQEGRTLPVGEGDYVNPAITRSVVERRKEGAGDKTHEVVIFQNDNWQDGIDMPAMAMKPQVIDAVGRALQLRIFDTLGIAPAYRAADPIIAGQIRRPNGKGVITFFVAWWLDEADL